GRRDPGGERAWQRAVRRPRHGRPGPRRRARRRAPAPRGDPRPRDRGAVRRHGHRARPPDALGTRLHAGQRPLADGAEPPRLRARRMGRIAGRRRRGCTRALGLRHEQDVARHDGRQPCRASGRRAVRRALSSRRATDERSQVRFLVERLAEFETLVTASDKEALILENNLIKQYRPRYNIRLKDDKSYVSVKVAVHDPWPRVLVTRKIVKDGSRYFGPFASASAVRETLDTIRKVFPLR